jgi:hypothetical protein
MLGLSRLYTCTIEVKKIRKISTPRFLYQGLYTRVSVKSRIKAGQTEG